MANTLALAMLTLAACKADEPEIPAMPSYAAHVRPILLANCVRCHGAGDMLNGEIVDGMVTNVASGGYFDHYEDRGDCVIPDGGSQPASCKLGAHSYAINPQLNAILYSYLHPQSDLDFRMPPPPAAPLTAAQLDIVDRWAMNPIP